MIRLGTLAAAALVGVAPAAGAQQIDTGTPTARGGRDLYGATSLGQMLSMGQTFVAPAGLPVLQSVQFWLGANGDDPPPQFRAFVATWSGTAVTRPVVYQTVALETGPTDVGPVPYRFTLPGGRLLDPGTTYIAFLTPIGTLVPTDNQLGTVYYSPDGDAYADGEAYFHSTPFGETPALSQLLDATRWQVKNPDLAFQATFAAAPAVVPEPATVTLVAAGLAAVGLLARRRRGTG
jgi:hypothetical protein